MLKNITFYFLLFFSSFALGGVDYHIEHSNNKIHVIGNFGKIKNIKSTELYTPGVIWGTDYTKQVKNIRIQGGEYKTQSSTVILYPHQDLIIEYDIVNLPSNQFTNEFTNKYYHYIDQDKFYILGLGLFVYPKYLEQQSNQDIKINIKSLSTVFYNKKPYLYKAPINIKFHDLQNIIILGNKGFYYTNDSKINTNIIVWSSDENLGTRLDKVTYLTLKRQKEFWQDKFDQTVIFIPSPYNLTRNKWGATVIKDTMLAFINPNLNEDDDLYNLVSHEGLHSWFGCNLLTGPRWFVEGFTDYYVDKINFKYSGDKLKFITNYNNKLLSYFSSPFYNLTEGNINKNFFSIQAIEKLPYLKGYLIAGQIDSIIDLDQILKSMINDCRQRKKNCTFPRDFLSKYSQNTAIYNLINNFNDTALEKTLFKKAFLFWETRKIIKYNLDLEQIINDNIVSGKYLNKLNKKYDVNNMYKLFDITQDFVGDLHFFINNNANQEEFYPLKSLEEAKIPQYILSN